MKLPPEGALSTVWPTLGLVLCMALPGLLRAPAPPPTTPQAGQRPSHRREISRDELLPVDRGFFDLAAATGGDFYFWSPAEFATADFPLPCGGEALLLAYGELDAAPRRFALAVDARRTLEIFAGAQRLEDLRITRPSGLAPAADPALEEHATTRMRRLRIDLAESGDWTLELSGRGLFALSVHAKGPAAAGAPEPIELVDLDFVERGGRLGHEGLFPLRRAVRPGQSVTLELFLSGPARSAEAWLVALDASVLAGPLERAWAHDPEDAERHYFGMVVPERPFRVLVRGLDATGGAYQRCFPSSVDPNAPEPPDEALSNRRESGASDDPPRR